MTKRERRLRLGDSVSDTMVDVESEMSMSTSDLSPQLWSTLPEDLLERVFLLLPVHRLFRARLVCRRWNSILGPGDYLRQLQINGNFPSRACQPAWFIMCADYNVEMVFAYDPTEEKWHSLRLPVFPASSTLLASAGGILCFGDQPETDTFGFSELFVCNPLLSSCQTIRPPTNVRTKSSIFSHVVGMVVNEASPSACFTIVMIVLNDNQSLGECKLTTHVFNSATGLWMTKSAALGGVPNGSLGSSSVCIKGVLYCMVSWPHHVLGFDVETGSWTILEAHIPGSTWWGQSYLTGQAERLLLVGEDISPEYLDSGDWTDSICIWELDQSDLKWIEVDRMCPDACQRLIGSDKTGYFSCAGRDDLIYFFYNGSKEEVQVLAYTISQKSWKWLPKCPTMTENNLFQGVFFTPSAMPTFL